ncbi:MAG TPA: ABC transporter permease, partial [Puia sp.]|nr:ABC transporter permease [Puia sp.]
MFRNYLKTAWRNLWKNRFYSAINVFGLAIGLTACLLIGVYIDQELSYDKFNANANRIVRVTMEYMHAGTVSTTEETGTKVGPQFKRTFPSVQAYARTYIREAIIRAGDKVFDEPRVLYADPAFFQMFSFHIVAGNAASALDAPGKAVLTQSMAKKYFGMEDPINKSLKFGNLVLTVSAICEDAPQNSQIKFDFATQFLNLGSFVQEENYWNANWITYLLLKNERDIMLLREQISAYMKTSEPKSSAHIEGGDYLTYHLEPLTRVHLYSQLGGFEPNGSISYIYIFGLIALTILVIASANYTNLATALSFGRGGEIGMRKVMGASRKQVFFQFIGESAIVTFAAACVAYILALMLIPSFDFITGRQFSISVLFSLKPVLALTIFSIVVSFFAGIYPALVLSGMEIMNVLKKGFRFTDGSNLLRKGLIVMQFGISVFLIIYTIIIIQQTRFLHNKDLGYEKEHVLDLPIGGHMLEKFQSIKDALLHVRGVECVTAAYDAPDYVLWGDGVVSNDEKGRHEVSIHALPTDLDFIKTMNMKMAAGRDFQATDLASMDTANKTAKYRSFFILNETLAKKLGWTAEQALNKIVSKGDGNPPGPVVGVVKDFNFTSLHEQIGPLLIFLGRDFSRRFLVRISGGDIQGTLSRLGATWKDHIADRP